MKLEGLFFLRYRTFDIFPGGQDHPAQAEFCGGTFRVYSTKEFPGLNPSTELTKVGDLFSCVFFAFSQGGSSSILRSWHYAVFASMFGKVSGRDADEMIWIRD